MGRARELTPSRTRLFTWFRFVPIQFQTARHRCASLAPCAYRRYHHGTANGVLISYISDDKRLRPSADVGNPLSLRLHGKKLNRRVDGRLRLQKTTSEFGDFWVVPVRHQVYLF
jgi:hypothetical protein